MARMPKLCPRRRVTETRQNVWSVSTERFLPCLESECALWNENLHECGELSGHFALTDIRNNFIAWLLDSRKGKTDA